MGDVVTDAEDGPAARIELDDEQALALYQWLESGDSPPYWETPLAPVQTQLSEWHRDGSPI